MIREKEKSAIAPYEGTTWNSSFTNDASDASLAKKAFLNRMPLAEEEGARALDCEKKSAGELVVS